MCGRMNHAGLTSRQLFEWLEYGILPEQPDETIVQSWNVPPTSSIPMLRRDGVDLRMDLARWWLVPHWHRGPLKEFKAATFNARSESVATSPTFRDAFKRNRCLIPATGYYEWQVRDGAKHPFFIHPAGNAPALLFAGLWTAVRLPDFEGLTCTILTEPSTGAMASLHSRRPVMLAPEHFAEWLDGAAPEALHRLADERIAWHEVGPAVGSVRNDGPELIEPVQ